MKIKAKREIKVDVEDMPFTIMENASLEIKPHIVIIEDKDTIIIFPLSRLKSLSIKKDMEQVLDETKR